jgi:hypothetical protein
MRVIRVATLVVCLFTINSVAYGDDPTVDLGVADPATPRTYAVEAGKPFNIKLTNAVPNKKYEIVGDKRVPEEKKVNVVPPDPEVECAAKPEQIARILEKIKKQKEAKAPAAEKDNVEVTEADIAAELAGDSVCTADPAGLDAAKKTLDEEKKKLDEEKAKTPPDETKVKEATDKVAAAQKTFDDEKKKVDDAQKLLDAAKDPGLQEIRNQFLVTFGTYSLKPGESLAKTFKASGEDITWPIVITTQGGSAATTAKAAAKAADPLASDSPVLDRLLATTRDQPDLVVGTCKYTDPTCSARIFINADQISTLTVTDIPAGAVTVRVTGGEYYPCVAVRYNITKYAEAPDTLIVPLHMRKGWLGIGSSSVANAEAEAASIYGIDWCPKTERALPKNKMFQNDPSYPEFEREVLARESKRHNKQFKDLSEIPDPRIETVKSPPIAALPLFLRGKSQVLELQFDWEDGTRKTFTIPVVYQRFWLDAGGFFVFTRRSDESIITSTVLDPTSHTPATPEMQKVLAINNTQSIEPSTGIVINIHPGNFPILAFQFGIAANQTRLPSYYLGFGIRAREIGKRGLATIGIGAAMQQEQRFPHLANGAEIPSTDDRLKPVNKYGVSFPYISLSLGFSFGGVSEKTNVADGVQR